MRLPICCVAIAKNEAKCLPALAESIRGLCDQLVIVDTGSTDGTPEVAESLGAIVHRIAWPDSFAEARNQAIALAPPADWYFMPDCDMQLQGDVAGLRRMCLQAPSGLHSVWIKTVIPFPSSSIWRKYQRLILRPGLWRMGAAKWAYRVHEQLIPTAPSTLEGIRAVGAYDLWQGGYLWHPDEPASDADHDARLRMATAELTDNPANTQSREIYEQVVRERERYLISSGQTGPKVLPQQFIPLPSREQSETAIEARCDKLE